VQEHAATNKQHRLRQLCLSPKPEKSTRNYQKARQKHRYDKTRSDWKIEPGIFDQQTQNGKLSKSDSEGFPNEILEKF